MLRDRKQSAPLRSAFSAVHVVSLDPVADLGELERSDAHRHVELVRLAAEVHPLVSGEDPDDLTQIGRAHV